jgi:hypothetical protein
MNKPRRQSDPPRLTHCTSVIMCLRSWDLISEEGEDDDGKSDDEGIRKDRELGRIGLDKVVMSLQL